MIPKKRPSPIPTNTSHQCEGPVNNVWITTDYDDVPVVQVQANCTFCGMRIIGSWTSVGEDPETILLNAYKDKLIKGYQHAKHT